ncbi:MAG: ABC transporter permease [Syntrophales bacterium]
MTNVTGIRISTRFFRVWERNFLAYRKNWKITFLPPLLEPLFYLIAFGVGLSMLIGKVTYRGESISYAEFIAPSLLAVNIMYNAFFETTYSSFVRMFYQKTFDAMMATPLSLEEVITGEIAWGATKSFIATILMMIVISAFGFIRYPEGLLIIPLSLAGGFAFGSIGMYFTSIIRTIDVFNLPIFLFITPMFLFSGTFFPLDTLPSWAQRLALIFPLTSLVDAARAFSMGVLDVSLIWQLAYLLAFGAVLFPLTIAVMRRRLIK